MFLTISKNYWPCWHPISTDSFLNRLRTPQQKYLIKMHSSCTANNNHVLIENLECELSLNSSLSRSTNISISKLVKKIPMEQTQFLTRQYVLHSCSLNTTFAVKTQICSEEWPQNHLMGRHHWMVFYPNWSAPQHYWTNKYI